MIKIARVLPVILVAYAPISNAGQAEKPAEIGHAKPQEKPPAGNKSIRESEATSDVPYSFQSVFGTGDATMAGLRERNTGKSIWVSKGDKIGGYTLESVDGEKSRAVLTKNGVRHTLRLALSSQSESAQTAQEKTPEAAKPKVDPVENKKIEKSLLNGARQISSAAQQYFSENAVNETELRKLRPYFGGNAFAPGTKIEINSGGEKRLVDISDKAADSLVLKNGDTFALHNDAYDKSASDGKVMTWSESKGVVSNTDINAKTTQGGNTGFVFSVDSAGVIN